MTLVDQAARSAVADDLDSTLFVEAGAGTGKTTALVGRVVSLVRSGVPIGAIAAIYWAFNMDILTRVYQQGLETGIAANGATQLGDLPLFRFQECQG